MSELSQRRAKLMVQIRRKERSSVLARMKEQLLAGWRQREQNTEIEAVLYAAFIAYEEDNGPLLDIYVNIETVLHHELCEERTSHLAHQLSIFLFLSLTSSDEVMTYMVMGRAVAEWEKLKAMLGSSWKCEELVYQRLRVFLELICDKYGVEPFHTGDLEGELTHIFTEEFTSQLAATGVNFQEDSEHSQFVETYLSMMPLSHLLPLLTTGFAVQALGSSNLCLTLLGRMDVGRGVLGELEQVFQDWNERIALRGPTDIGDM